MAVKKASVRSKLLAIGISLLFALVVSEVSLRAFDYHPGTMDPEMFVRNDNELLPYKLRANYEGYCAGQDVKIDSDGYRIVEPRYETLQKGKPDKPDRVVLILGDSGVFGFGVGNAETIASQLQDAYSKRNLNYRVGNIGVNGYTSWNEYAALADYLRKFSATDVILLYMPNDLTFDNDYFGIGKGHQASFSKDEDRLHRFTRFLYSRVYVSYLVADGLKRISKRVDNAAAAAIVSFDESQMQREIEYSMEALRKTQELCKARHIKFSVGIYRDVAYESDPKGWLTYEGAIQRNLERNGIRWFVAKSHMDNLKASEVRSSWNDPHPGAKAIGFIVSDIMGAVSAEE